MPVDLMQLTLDEEKIFEDIEKRAKRFEDRVYDLQKYENIIDAKNTLFKYAFNRAKTYTERYALDLLVIEAKKACMLTGEFDYDLYLDHFESAIRATKDLYLRMVDFYAWSDGEVSVSIDLSPLGTIDQWAAVVKRARRDLEIGRAASGAVRTNYWIRMVYGPGREGMEFPKRIVKNKKTGEEEEKEIHPKVDYETVIATRLSYLSGTDAPYWSLIDNGNATTNAKFTSPGTSPGTAYPTFSPTNFVAIAENKIIEYFKMAYRRFRATAESHFTDMLASIISEQLSASVKNVRELNEKLDSYLANRIAVVGQMTEDVRSTTSQIQREIDEIEANYTKQGTPRKYPKRFRP